MVTQAVVNTVAGEAKAEAEAKEDVVLTTEGEAPIIIEVAIIIITQVTPDLIILMVTVSCKTHG